MNRSFVNSFGAGRAPASPDLVTRMKQKGGLFQTLETVDNVRTDVGQPAESPPYVSFTSTKAIARRPFGTSRMAVEWIRVTGSVQLESHIRSSCHTLIGYERGSRKVGKTVVEGVPPSLIRDLTQRLVYVPAGVEYCDQYMPGTHLSAVYFYFSPELLSNVAISGATSLTPRLFFENTSLWRSIQKLKGILEKPTFENGSYFEAIGNLLVHEVAHAYSSTPASQPPTRGGLAPWQQRIVISYIDKHLAEVIPLAALAGLVRLSPYHFCRAFKQSFGMPPHRYHLNRRVEAAKQMLFERDQSITDIGLALGFGTSSAFSVAFRKATGTTPSSYQRSAE